MLSCKSYKSQSLKANFCVKSEEGVAGMGYRRRTGGGREAGAHSCMQTPFLEGSLGG